MKFFLIAGALLAAISFPCLGAPPKTSTLSRDEEPKTPPVWKRLKAEVITPLFVKQAAGVNTLASVTLSARAIPIKGESPRVLFVPDLGRGGEAVIIAATKLLKTVHKGWPPGHRVELSFNPPIAPDDAPASALAIALILDSMIAGWEADPACSIVGGLRDDGKVFAATSALMRLTTASRSSASRIIMPEKNATEAADCMINEGIAGTGRVQMFAVKDFDEVLQMAAATPDPDMAKAMEIFADVQKSLSVPGVDPETLLKQNDVLESLRSVLEKWQNHMSARLLLGHARGLYKTFSLPGSVEAVDRIAGTLLKGISSMRPYEIKGLPPEQINTEVATLRVASPRLDPKARPYLEALLRYGDTARIWNSRPSHTAFELEEFMATMSAAAGKVRDLRGDMAALIHAQK